MNSVKLIYFEGCPNAQKAKDALSKRGIPFEVMVQDNLNKDSPYHEYSSPTILDGDSLIFGQRIGRNSAACSAEKFDEDLIFKKLGNHPSNRIDSTKKGKLATIGSLGSGLTVGLCPVCIPAIGAFLSSIGLGFLVKESVLHPLLLIFLILTMGGLFYSYLKEHRNIWPLILGAASGTALYLGRYVYFGSFINSALMYGGIVAIISVSLWNLYLRKQSNCSSCTPQKDEVIL